MRHTETVQEEFTRQGESFRDSSVLSAAELTSRLAGALGDGHERVLDIACGPGVLFPTLASCARSVVGVDLTFRTLQLAREALPAGSASVVQALGERLPFRTHCFDAAVLRLALHHFVEPGSALAAARAVVRPDGRLVVLDLLAPEEPEARALRDALERLRDPSHTRLLALDEMRDQIIRAGFSAPEESLWSQRRDFAEWATIINEPGRMRDLGLVLDALAAAPGDPAGLGLGWESGALRFTHHWGLFTATAV